MQLTIKPVRASPATMWKRRQATCLPDTPAFLLSPPTCLTSQKPPDQPTPEEIAACSPPAHPSDQPAGPSGEDVLSCQIIRHPPTKPVHWQPSRSRARLDSSPRLSPTRPPDNPFWEDIVGRQCACWRVNQPTWSHLTRKCIWMGYIRWHIHVPPTHPSAYRLHQNTKMPFYLKLSHVLVVWYLH